MVLKKDRETHKRRVDFGKWNGGKKGQRRAKRRAAKKAGL